MGCGCIATVLAQQLEKRHYQMLRELETVLIMEKMYSQYNENQRNAFDSGKILPWKGKLAGVRGQVVELSSQQAGKTSKM